MIGNKTEGFDLEFYAAKLLMSETFFAALSRNVNKVSNPKMPFYAGVRVTPGGYFELISNPLLMETLTDSERLAIIQHEYYHLIFGHLTTRKMEGVNPRASNIAMDLAINSHLLNTLPKKLAQLQADGTVRMDEENPGSPCIPGEGLFADYPVGMSAEWYLSKMMEDPQFQGGSGDGEGEPSDGEGEEGAGGGRGGLDDHSQWDGSKPNDGKNGQVTQSDIEIAKQRAQEMMEKAADEASRANNWGTVSTDLQKQILDMIKSRVNWQSVLRYFVKTSQRAGHQHTIKKLNRRSPYLFAGKRVVRTANIAVCIDESGSVSDKMLIHFFAALNALSKLATFTVVPFDHEVDEANIYEWRKGTHKIPTRTKTGGTCFDAPTRWVNESGKFDGMVILTDMGAPKPMPAKCRRLWMTDEANAENPYFQTDEKVIGIPMDT